MTAKDLLEELQLVCADGHGNKEIIVKGLNKKWSNAEILVTPTKDKVILKLLW